MKDVAMRRVAFWIALAATAVALLGMVAPSFRATVVPPTTALTAAVAVSLFFRILFSSTYRADIDRANLEMKGDDPWPGKPKPLSDKMWGLFGTRAGNASLLWLRAVLVMGLIPVALLQAWLGTEVLYLWLAAAFVVMQLSLMHAALHS